MSVIKDIDRGWNRIVKETSEFAKRDVYVGWIEGKNQRRPRDVKQTIKNGELAMVHEYGTKDKKIPAGRLGFREWADRSKNEIGDALEDAWGNTIAPGGRAVRELHVLGLWAVASWIKYLITVQPGPQWADSTDLAKVRKLGGHKQAFREKKLIVTSQLINAASYVVTARGAKDK